KVEENVSNATCRPAAAYWLRTQLRAAPMPCVVLVVDEHELRVPNPTRRERLALMRVPSTALTMAAMSLSTAGAAAALTTGCSTLAMPSMAGWSGSPPQVVAKRKRPRKQG